VSPHKIVQIVSIVMLVALMLDAGMQANREHLVAALKNYGLLARALIANFVIVPIVGVLIARLLQLDAAIATGFLLMAIAPGVPFLVRAAGRQPGGSLGFATALTFILPALSVVTIPITSRLVLPLDAQAHLPLTQFLTTLVLFQLVPLLIGLLVSYSAPALALKLTRPLTLIFAVAVVALLAMLFPMLVKSVTGVYGSRAMLAELCIVLFCIGTGWLLGGPEVPHRRTLSIATALRNIGLCALIAATAFPDSLAEATVFTYFIVQFIVVIIFRVLFQRAAQTAST
jgi:bile acid:Na+ symporter, BASS family